MPRSPDTEHEKGKEKPKGAMTVQEAGKVGGEIRKERLGHEGYSELGKSPEVYSELGHKGGQRVKQLVEEGKRAAEKERPAKDKSGGPKPRH